MWGVDLSLHKSKVTKIAQDMLFFKKSLVLIKSLIC